MTSIGETLRRQRLQNRISLEKISLDTKIGVRLLEAIEAEQFEKLPGGVFRRSFVLQYARALGVDSEEIAAQLKQLNHFDDEQPIQAAPATPGRPESGGFAFPPGPDLSGMGGSTLGSLIAAVGVMMACALVYSWWQTPRQSASTPKVAIAAERSPKPAEPAAAPAATPAPVQAVQAASPPVQANTSPVQVGLSADEKTWISISSDGKNVFANALQPHETKTVSASAKVRLLIGNAGGVEISLNGKSIGPVGPRGQIRIVELTPAGFQIVPRTLEPL